ncbi:MAG: hypothetical protein NC489_45210 [Ruminococcus flavefaciens]|nr:hypothetical protein [Ruminococcus flavefaciens]
MSRETIIVVNDKSLISFSIISTSWEKYKKDNIDLIIPFVLYYFAESDNVDLNNPVSITDAKKYIESEFGLKILSNVMEVIFNRMTQNEYNILRKTKRNFYLKRKDLDTTEFKANRRQNEMAQQFVLESFYDFLNDAKINYQKIDAKNSLVAYLCNYGKDVISQNEVKIEKDDFWNYKVGEFVQYISKYDQRIFEFVKDIAKGGMISSVIFSNSNNYHTNNIFRNTEIYYDTSLLMHILGYSGEALQESVKELTILLQKQKAKICYFRHNLDELKGILNAYISLYNQNKLLTSYNFDYFIEKKVKPETISEYIALLEKNLEKEGLILKETPNYANYENNIDWTKFDQYLQNNISYINPDRRENDIESLAAIYRLRKGVKYTTYEECRALFVTTNKALVYHAKYYFKHDENKVGVPVIVDDTFLTALMWMKNDNANESLPNLKIISDALASQSLSSDFWNAFVEKVQKYEADNTISSNEAVGLKVDIFTRKNAYDVTSGDIDKINHSSLMEILARNELQKHRDIISENEKLLTTNKEKEVTINELANNLINSRVQFYLSQLLKPWKILIVIGKLWEFILCIFLVLLAKLTDYILQNNNSLFVNISVVSIVVSIIIKFIDMKFSSYNKGIENFFYKKALKSLKKMVTHSEEKYSNEIISVIKSKVKEFKSIPD